MAASHLIRLGKIKGDNGILVALKHNKRTLQNERGASANIDAARTSFNYAFAGDATPETIARYAKSQMMLAGIEKPRINCVRAVEVVFSLPIDRHQQDTKLFFTACYGWVEQTFAGELLSFDVHLDESAPHAHALILPLINGKMQGRDMVGNTGNLMRIINKFHADVARHFGLSKSDKTLSSMDKQSIEKLVLASLKTDPAMQSKVWACIRDAVKHDPIPYAQMLSIKQPVAKKGKNKSFVDHKRSMGKGKFIT